MFKSYLELLDRLDAFGRVIKARHGDRFFCTAGCGKCCVTGITLWQIEYDRIKKYLNDNPIDTIKKRPEKCAFLKDDETCAIYTVRPMICRMWGLPLLINSDDANSDDAADAAAIDRTGLGSTVKHSPEKTLMSCELNFVGTLETLPKEDILNAWLVRTTLAAINHVYCKKTSQDPFVRLELN
jgi:hypothetical protein